MITRHCDAHHLSDNNLIFTNDRFGSHGTYGKNRAFRRIDHGSEFIDPKHAQIADRKARTCIFFRAESARTRSLGQFADFTGDLTKRLPLCRTHHWRYQAVLDCHGDADVGAFIVSKYLFLKRSIDFRMLDKGSGSDFNNNVIETDLQFRIQRINTASHFRGPVHFDLACQKEMWDRAERSNQPASNRAANLTHRFIAIRRSPHCSCLLKTPRLDGTRKTLRDWCAARLADRHLDVFLDNAPTRSTAL